MVHEPSQFDSCALNLVDSLAASHPRYSQETSTAHLMKWTYINLKAQAKGLFTIYRGVGIEEKLVEWEKFLIEEGWVDIGRYHNCR